jgi:hypothetical protein
MFQHHCFPLIKTYYILHCSRPCVSSRNLGRRLVPLEIRLGRLTTLKYNFQVTNKTLASLSRLAFAFFQPSVAKILKSCLAISAHVRLAYPSEYKIACNLPFYTAQPIPVATLQRAP